MQTLLGFAIEIIDPAASFASNLGNFLTVASAKAGIKYVNNMTQTL
jgi:hypothetical protein